MKIAYRIMACPERVNFVAAEVKKLSGLDVKVFYDTRPKGSRTGGAMYTYELCVQDVINKDYTHVVIIQDDVLLVNRFDECIKKLIQKRPDHIWTCFCSRLHTIDYDNPYIEINPANAWGQCNIIPIYLLRKIIKFKQELLPRYPHDDNLLAIYCIENGMPIYTTAVSLLQHLCPTNSVLGFNNKNKVSKVWAGEDIFEKVNWESDIFKVRRLPLSCNIQKEYEKWGGA